MSREDLHFRLRIPPALKAEVEASAAANGRSITAEIVHRVGLDWFTDEQIRDIRENITMSERNRMKRQAESRAEYRRAALNERNAA